jgi:hypothetical protein
MIIVFIFRPCSQVIQDYLWMTDDDNISRQNVSSMKKHSLSIAKEILGLLGYDDEINKHFVTSFKKLLFGAHGTVMTKKQKMFVFKLKCIA